MKDHGGDNWNLLHWIKACKFIAPFYIVYLKIGTEYQTLDLGWIFF